jgi:hypothetical protein
MFGFGKRGWKKRTVAQGNPCARPPVQEDQITLSLPLLDITVVRKLNTDVPHEVSVIVPRAEIRYTEGSLELIYNSITVVHAPRHPLAGEQPPETGAMAGTAGSPGPVPADKPAKDIQPPSGTGAVGELAIAAGGNPMPTYHIVYRKN